MENNNNDKTRTIQALSVDTQVLIKHLEATKPEELVTYEKLGELLKLTKAEIIGRKRYILESARGIVKRESKIVFDAVFGIGLKRLNDSEIIGHGDRTMNHIRRTSRNACKTITCADYKNLSNEDKIRSNTHLSLFGAISQCTKPCSVKRLEGAVTQAQGTIDARKTLAMFGASPE